MMKRKTMMNKKIVDKKYLKFALVLLVLLLCSACGPKLIRGQPPLVRMNELSHQDGVIKLELRMRNVNGLLLEVQSIKFTMTMNDAESFTYKGPVNTKLIANGAETWSMQVDESQALHELFDSLESGDVISVPYALKGSVTTLNEGTLRFEHEGHIYPLPGRLGHFR
jgi:hypothetical protein